MAFRLVQSSTVGIASLTVVSFTAVFLLGGCGRPPDAPPVAPAQEIIADTANATVAAPITHSPDDWPGWRGPQQDGVAANSQVPTSWSDSENVVWKTALPGRGHSSPIVVGDFIYLETADEENQIQSVMSLNRKDGASNWLTPVHRGGFESAMHAENSQASSTLAWDGNRLFAVFLNDRKIRVTALSGEGNILWQKDIGEFASKFGYSSSPALHEHLCFISADHSGGGFLAAIHRESGDILWRKPRDRGDSYASPRVIDAGGRTQVILGGTRQVVSYDPRSGEQLWSVKGTAEAVVGTAVVTRDLIFASGGYPEAETLAIKPDGAIAWRKKEKSYVPSLLAYDGHVFLANDEGVILCWDATTGQERWKHRVGGSFRVSPLLAGDNIYITDMTSKTTVFKASAEGFESIAENRLGTEAFASPAVSRNQLFLRVADTAGGKRQEYLYCIGEEVEEVSRR